MPYNPPGKINYMNERGSATGCRAIVFTSADDLNTFFEQNSGLLVVEIKPLPTSALLCLYTQALGDEELEDFREFNYLVREHMDKKRAERDEQKAKNEEAKLKAEAEAKRLAELGRKCENNHKGLNRAMLKAAQKEEKLLEIANADSDPQ